MSDNEKNRFLLEEWKREINEAMKKSRDIPSALSWPDLIPFSEGFINAVNRLMKKDKK